MSYEFSYAPTNRAMCKGACKNKIEKGAVRMATFSDGMGDYTVAQYRCLNCVTDKQIANIKAKVGSLEEVQGFDGLSAEDQALVLEKDPDKPKAGAGKAKAKAAVPVRGGKKAAAPPAPPVAVQHTFLDRAKDYNFDAVKKMLAEHPGLLNLQPAGRWSALHQFAACGNTEAVEFLLAEGASRDVKTNDGQTPMDVAHEKCKPLLEEPAPEPVAPPARVAPKAAAAAAAASSSDVPAEKAAEAAKRKAPVAAAKALPNDEPPAKKAKMGRPVDSTVPNRSEFSVLDDWSVCLNQTNIVANNNKYYKIQLLKKTDGSFHVWTHWGRVGTSGQWNLSGFGNMEVNAIAEFKSKFKQKSGVHHEMINTHDWTPTVGKYTLVETDEQEGAEGGDTAPLGKLTPQQIEKGQAVLQKIEAALEKKDVTTLQNLSSSFYTLVPHDFGFAKPPVINTKDMLESEEELLKFYLRMGFEEMDKVDDGLTPVAGIMELPLPKTLEACGKICAAGPMKASSATGAKHAEKQSGKPTTKMEGFLYAAIMLYTSNAIYRDLNKVLRSEDRTKIKKYFPYLRMLLEALGRLPQQKRTLWRGVSVDLFDQYPVGSTVTWWGVSSCTSELQVAKNFMKGCGGKCTLLTVETKTAADISEITFFGNEKENLLAPGTQLKVLSSKREGKTTEIKMEEVGRVLG